MPAISWDSSSSETVNLTTATVSCCIPSKSLSWIWWGKCSSSAMPGSTRPDRAGTFWVQSTFPWGSWASTAVRRNTTNASFCSRPAWERQTSTTRTFALLRENCSPQTLSSIWCPLISWPATTWSKISFRGRCSWSPSRKKMPHCCSDCENWHRITCKYSRLRWP